MDLDETHISGHFPFIDDIQPGSPTLLRGSNAQTNAPNVHSQKVCTDTLDSSFDVYLNEFQKIGIFAYTLNIKGISPMTSNKRMMLRIFVIR